MGVQKKALRPRAAMPPGNGPRTKATREAWLRTALDALVRDGVEQVKILALAKRLGVSRSSFYWQFKSREDLLGQLLGLWRDTNTRAIVEQAQRPAPTITRGVLNLFECWVDERRFDPRLDFAIREWSRRSSEVRRVVDRADEERVAAIRDLFRRHGFAPVDAFIRARVLYFMQIGYYALELGEPLDTRLSYVTAYLVSFTGQDPAAGEVEAFVRAVKSRSAPGKLSGRSPSARVPRPRSAPRSE